MGLNEERQDQVNLYIEIAILAFIVSVFSLLRFIARHISEVNFWWDDWLFFIAAVSCLIEFLVTAVYVAKAGPGYVNIQEGGSMLAELHRLQSGAFVTYLLSLLITKMSILLYYWRIFGTYAMHKIVYGLLAVLIGWFVGSVVVPMKNGIDSLQTNSKAYYLGNGIANILTDFTLMFLPLPIIWRLQMSNWHKFGLICTFAIGSMTCICSIVRLTVLLKSLRGGHPVDILYQIDTWSVAETGLALCATCIPSLGLLVKRVKGELSTRRKRREDAEDLPDQTTGDGCDNSIGEMHPSRTFNQHKGFQRLDEDNEYAVALRQLSAG